MFILVIYNLNVFVHIVKRLFIESIKITIEEYFLQVKRYIINTSLGINQYNNISS